MNESTVSGVYDTGVYNGQTVNGPLPSLGGGGYPSAGCAGAIPMGGMVMTLGGQGARCSSCGGGLTTQWTAGNGYSTLQERTYCAWCEDPRTVALKAQITP